MRPASVSPDLSLAASRVSDTVMTAMRTGTKATLSSIPGIAVHCVGWRRGDRGRARRRRLRGRNIDRPLSGRRRVEARRQLAHATAVHPVIHEQALYIGARLRDANAFDEEERVVFLA